MAQSKFETSLKQLETLVRKLEGGDLTLEESLKAFEEGIGLARQCEKVLSQAKGKVQKLIETESGLTEVPLDPQEL